MFRRTANGLSNEHLFHRVDYIVYCEGEMIDNVSLSLDEVFWGRVFSASQKKFRVKSVGSKTSATGFLQDIKSGTLKNTIVALDADYEFFCREIPDHPLIFYTHGYSWESDAVQNIDFETALALFCNVRDVEAAKSQFHDFMKVSESQFWRATLIDMRYIASPGKLFNRQKPMSIIKFGSDGYPKLGCGDIVARARALRSTGTSPQCLPIEGPSNGMRYFFGKAAARFVYHWFVAFSSRLRSKRNVPYDAFMSLLIGAIDVHSGNGARDIYFRRLLARI
jgi:hypothetical protein